MKEAVRQAKKAGSKEEVPIGCVIVHEDKIIARGYNKKNAILFFYILLYNVISVTKLFWKRKPYFL